MKTLYLLRHAQTMASAPGGDKERALSPEGINEASALGRTMKIKGYQPGAALCSTALRTQQTLEQITNALENPVSVSHEDALYYSSGSTYLQVLNEMESNPSSVLLVAHNPSIYELAITLVGRGDDGLLNRLGRGGYAPATLTVLSCPVAQWGELARQQNDIIDLLEPADYTA